MNQIKIFDIYVVVLSHKLDRNWTLADLGKVVERCSAFMRIGFECIPTCVWDFTGTFLDE